MATNVCSPNATSERDGMYPVTEMRLTVKEKGALLSVRLLAFSSLIIGEEIGNVSWSVPWAVMNKC